MLEKQTTYRKARPSNGRSFRLGIAGQFRLIISVALVVAVLGIWSYVELTDTMETAHNLETIDRDFEESNTIVVALRKEPTRVARVLEWLKEHYEYASFLVVDDEYTFIAQSEPPPPLEVLDKVANYHWDIALVLPLVDAKGERFYVTVIQDPPSTKLTWIHRYELILPAFVMIVFLIATMVLARRVLGPIRQISSVAQAIADGALHQRTSVSQNNELGDLAHAFNVMADRNAELLLAQKHLLAQVGHELRTPLARVRVALDIARDRITEANESPLADADVDLEEMARLISDILAVSRLETADVQGTLAETLRTEEFQFATLTEEIVGRFSTTHPGRTRCPSPIATCELLGDRVLLGRVLWNLLENAHNHSPPDTAIELHTTVENQHAIWVVNDAGDGIAPELLERVFEPFFQGRSSGASTMGGFGLGLSLCRRVVDAHRGSIKLENRVEGGLSVRVMLPLAPATEVQL